MFEPFAPLIGLYFKVSEASVLFVTILRWFFILEVKDKYDVCDVHVELSH